MSNAQLCVLFFMCLLCAGQGQVIDRVGEAEDGQFPHMALVEALYKFTPGFTNKRQPWRPICGGTILGHYWVLTAEHCLMAHSFVDETTGGTVEASVDRLRVMVGSVNTNDKNGRREVATWYYPGSFNKYYHDKNSDQTFLVDDILLLRLRCKLQLVRNKIWPAKLPRPNQDLQADDRVIFAGWGVKNENFETSNTLLYGHSDVVEQYYCRYFLNDRYSFNSLQKIQRMIRYLSRKTQRDEFLESSQICVGQREEGEREGSVPFSGDSGGGLFKGVDEEWIVYGVMSYSVDNDSPGVAGQVHGPAAFTRVSHYRPWIIETFVYDPYTNSTVIDPFFEEYYRQELEEEE